MPVDSVSGSSGNQGELPDRSPEITPNPAREWRSTSRSARQDQRNPNHLIVALQLLSSKLTRPAKAISKDDRSHRAPPGMLDAINRFIEDKEQNGLDLREYSPAGAQLFPHKVVNALSDRCQWCILPNGLRSLPAWIDHLHKLRELRIPNFLGTSLQIENLSLHDLIVDGPSLRYVYVPNGVRVCCPHDSRFHKQFTVNYPPDPLRRFSSIAADSLGQLSTLFKPFDYGVSAERAPSDQRLGFWLALGVAQTPDQFRPACTGLTLSGEEKFAARDSFKKLPPTGQLFIRSIQGGGENARPYRDGLDIDRQGQDTRRVIADLYAHATSHRAGTTVYRWMNMADSTLRQIMAQPVGLVFQNPGPMSTALDPASTSWRGKHRLVIHYSDGALALDSFASNASHIDLLEEEMEVTTLPGTRFMVLHRTMVPDTEHDGPDDPRLELELLMLPPVPAYVRNLAQ